MSLDSTFGIAFGVADVEPVSTSIYSMIELLVVGVKFPALVAVVVPELVLVALMLTSVNDAGTAPRNPTSRNLSLERLEGVNVITSPVPIAEAARQT